MKRKLLFAAMTLIAGAWSLSASAQTWVPSEVGEGYALLYNVGTEKYFTRGNGWNTQASIGGEGAAMTVALVKVGNNYKIRTQNSNGLECLDGSSVYTDQSQGKNSTWTFEEIDATNHIYNIISAENHGGGSGKYLTAEGGESTILIPGNDGTTPNAQWKILLHEDRPDALLQAMKNATTETPVDVTSFIKDANFGSYPDVAFQCWTISASNKNLNGGNLANPCAESYHSTFDLAQTISVPNGYYKLTAQGFYRKDGGDDTKPYFYINDEKATFPLKTGSENSMTDASNSFSNGSYIIDPIEVTVTTKSITVGAKLETNTALWCIWDNFVLTYMGPLDLSSFKTALGDAITAAKAIITAPMNADVASKLATAISDYDGQTYDNEEDYGTAIAAVNTAIANANTSVANYAAVKAAIDYANTKVVTLDADGQAAFDISAIETAYANGTITNDDYATCITNINNALRAAAKAQTTPGSDMTLAIVNPGIDGNADGWTTYINGNGGYAGGPMKPSNDAMEFWGAGTLTDQDKGKSFDYYQTITELPAGVYTISADMLNSTNGEEGAVWNGGGKAGLYGKTQTAEVKALITTDGETFISYTTDEITVINGELRIGVKNFEPLTGRWFACDNFKLTFVGPVQDLTPYIAAYNAAKTAAEATSAKTDKMAASIRTELDATIAATVDQDSQEELENATAALVEITAKAEKSLASYAVIKSGVIPDNSLEGWVCETYVPNQDVRFQINTWSTEGNSDGSNMKTPFIENWTPGGNYLGAGKVYYKLEYLEPGEVYYAQAHVRSYNEANADAPNGPDFFINDNTTKLSDEGTTFTYNNMSGIYATLKGLATVGADGTLTLGVDIAADRNYNWVAFKSVKIQALEDADVIISEEDTSVPVIGVPKSVTLTRTLKGGQWNGFSVPFGFTVDGSALEDAEVMKFKSVTDNEITLEDATEIVAGEPYLVKPAADVDNLKFNGVVVSNPAEAVHGDGSYKFAAHLYNTALATDGSVAYVSTTDSKIYKLTSGGIKGLRAIFNIPTGSEAKALVVNFGDGTTGILNVDSEGNVYEGNVYNIAGQRVNMTQKGLYIVNGKKVLIK